MALKTAFFETSAINFLYKQNTNGKQLNAALKSSGLIPVVGNYTAHELAKDFLNNDCGNTNFERTKALFTLVKELDPDFTYECNELEKMDARKLKYGESVFPFIIRGSNRFKSAHEIMDKYMQGTIHPNHGRLVDAEQAEIRQSLSNVWGELNDEIKQKNYRKYNKSFDEFLTNFFSSASATSELIKYILVVTNIELNELDILKFRQNMCLYPVLRTMIYSNLYLSFVTVKGKNIPAEDKLTDQVQLTDAAYCSMFISSDERHLKYADEIHPDIELKNTRVLIDELLN